MDNQELRIDRLFRQGLETYAPARPSASVWKKVRAAIDPRENRRRKWLFFLLAIGFCAGITADSTPGKTTTHAQLHSAVMAAKHKTVMPADEPSHYQPQTPPIRVALTQVAAEEKTAINHQETAILSGYQFEIPTENKVLAEVVPDPNGSALPLILSNSGGDLLNDERKNDSTLREITPPVTGQKDPGRWPFTLGIFAGPSVSWNHLHAKESAATPWCDIRNAQEKESWSYTAGIEAAYRFAGGFSLMAGLELTNIGEQSKYDWSVISGVDTSGSYGQVIMISYPDPNNPNNTIIEFDSIWFHLEDTLQTQHQLSTTNRYTYISIPLMLAYEFNGRRLGLRAAAGASVDFLTGARGTLPANDLSGFTTLSLNNAPLKHTTFTLICKLGISCRLGKNSSLLLEPTYRFSPWSMQKNTAAYTIKYDQFSLRAGYIYHF